VDAVVYIMDGLIHSRSFQRFFEDNQKSIKVIDLIDCADTIDILPCFKNRVKLYVYSKLRLYKWNDEIKANVDRKN